MLKSFWNKISNVGIPPDYNEPNKKQITLINQFNFISLIVYFLSALNNFAIGLGKSSIVDLAFASVCFFGFVFNYFRLYKLAMNFLFINIIFGIVYFDSYSGTASGAYLYYFPVILSVAYVLDFRRDRLRMFIYFAITLLSLVFNILTEHKLFENKDLSEVDKQHLFIFNALLCTAAVCFLIYLTIINNLRENNLLEQQIKERKESEEKIQLALKEKEILLAELHHRVKNNMAIISGLFSFTIDMTKSEEAKVVLRESKNRVHSMALIHNKLYKSKNLSGIDFKDYTNALVEEVKYSYPNLNEEIEIKLNFIEIDLDINQAIPCGLIMNEVLTNCFKHAFFGRKSGLIHIELKRENDCLKLIIKDNGIGLIEGYANKDSIGMLVIESLTDQLEGTYQYTSLNGTQFELRFVPKKIIE